MNKPFFGFTGRNSFGQFLWRKEVYLTVLFRITVIKHLFSGNRMLGILQNKKPSLAREFNFVKMKLQ